MRFLSILPLPVLYAVCGALAFLLRILGWRYGYVRDGLARCLPGASEAERRRVAVDFYRHLGELVAEAVHGWRITEADLVERLRFENAETVEQALRDGRKVLLLTSHQCNWEWLLLRCSTAFGVPLSAAYKPTRRERVNRELASMRSRLGATMVPAKQVVNYLAANRRTVRLMALVADQSPPAGREQRHWIRFFGTDTDFFAGPGWISARMNFVPIFIAMRREGRGQYVARFVPLGAADRAHPERTLEAYVRAVEEAVHAQPAQYFWAYNRWKRTRRTHE